MWSRRIAVIVTGSAFGAAATWLNVPSEEYILDGGTRRVASLVVNAGAAWAGMAVLAGWLLGSVRQGLLGGPLALVPAVVVYYVVGAAVGSENPDGSADQIVFFSLLALATGPALGAVGGVIRRTSILGLVAALVVPLGVGVELVWRSFVMQVQPDPARPAADLILLTLAVTGAAAAAIRHRRAATRLDPLAGSRPAGHGPAEGGG